MPRKSNVIAREMRAIHASFRQLAHSFRLIAPLLGDGAMAMAAVQKPRRRPRRSVRISRARRAALKLHGRYMGLTRLMPPRQKSKVKKIRAERGIRAAIAAARRMAG